MSFLSTKYLNLDSKQRMTVPASYRERIRNMCEGQMVLTKSAPIIHADGRFEYLPSLWLYPMNEWQPVQAQVMKLSATSPVGRKMHQEIIANAEEVNLDAGGRVLLPAHLCAYAQIEKQLVLLGQGNKFEIWQQQAWEKHSGLEGEALIASEELMAQIAKVDF